MAIRKLMKEDAVADPKRLEQASRPGPAPVCWRPCAALDGATGEGRIDAGASLALAGWVERRRAAPAPARLNRPPRAKRRSRAAASFRPPRPFSGDRVRP